MPAAEVMPIVGRFSGRVLQPYGMPKGMNPREWRQSVQKPDLSAGVVAVRYPGVLAPNGLP
uniref:hypothetical protein n=1 Tax=Mesorhizobium sp. dw_380 TaxID=2812001 RepID=UPI001BDE222F